MLTYFMQLLAKEVGAVPCFFYAWPCAFFFLGFLNFTITDSVTDIHTVSAQNVAYFNLIASVGKERAQFVEFVRNTSSVDVLKVWESEDKFEEDYIKESNCGALSAIVIEEWEPPKYKIRLPYDPFTANPTEEISYEQVMFDANHTDWYYNKFVPLQLLVGDFFMGNQNSTTVLKTQRLKHPDYHYSSINGLLPNLQWCLFMGFFFYAAIISTLFVAESDKQKLIPFLEAIGVNKITYLASWMLYFVIAVSPMIGTIFFSFIFFDSTTAGIQLTIVAMLFGLALILWTIFALTLFPGPFAMGSIVLSWIAILIPLVLFDVTDASPAVQYVASIIPHVNLFCATKKALSGQIVIGHIGMFLLSITLLYFLILYCDLVIPREGKEIAHPCLCFLAPSRELHFDYTTDHVAEIETIDQCEPLTIGIHIENLYKYYDCDVWGRLCCDGGNQVHAVQDVTLDIYKDQVFVLLGHNGAGKTSFCNVLNGRNTLTSGKVLINGQDIVLDREEINRTQGICPQENVLWDNLTLLQHLQIHSRLKSAPISDIDNILEDFNLSKRKKTKAKFLSGGEKRKLSVAIAFLGNPSVVYLDEPTCSMDPVSQRQVWNLIAKRKKGRVIILTTHFMQEAEVLGDRIGILKDGFLQICGSTMFLKSKCGVGYTLRIFGQGDEELSKILEDASNFLTPVGKLEYTASFSDSHNFPKFFQQLEEIHKGGFALEVTSLEELFSKVSKINTKPKETDPTIFHSNSISFLMQVWVLIKQKYYSKRKWSSILTPIPLILYCAFVFNLVFDETKSYDALPISLDAYHNISIPVAEESSFTRTLPHPTIQLLSATENNFAEEIFKLHGNFLIYGGYCNESMVLYNTTSMHSLPAFVNALNSFYFQRAWNRSNATISVANYPLPLRDKHIRLMQDQAAIMLILMLVMCVKSTLTKYTLQIWRERVTSQFKGTLLRMGATHKAYWLSALIYYYANYCAMLLVMVCSAIIFQLDDIFHQQPATIPILLIAGPALILAWFFNTLYYEKIQAFMMFIQCRTIVAYTAIGILFLMQDTLLLYILYLIPDLAFYDAILKIVIAHIHDEHPAELVPIICFLIFDAFLWLFIILKKEHCKQNPSVQGFCSCKSSKKATISVVEEKYDEDEDVAERRREILSSSVLPTEICFANARKVYPGKPAGKCCSYEVEKAKDPVIAVGNVSIRAREGQTVALLGPNGAGKTTLLKALIGKHALTSGTATVNGKDVGYEQEDIRKSLGYCDQGSSSSKCMTGMQHLEIIMGLRGISDPLLTDIISSEFQLTQHLNKKVKHFSGGTKRKLEGALSLIGLPSFLILDEPTVGVDTFARKSIYELVRKTKDGRTFLLTTHSMEEAELLADEICIMVNGRVRCIGTATHLKRRFAQGYGSEINPFRGKSEEVRDAILSRFPDAERVNHDEFKLRFRFPKSRAWELFQFFEEDLKDSIKDYLVGSTTLEQVFMALAKEQVDCNGDVIGWEDPPMTTIVVDETSEQTSLDDTAGTPSLEEKKNLIAS